MIEELSDSVNLDKLPKQLQTLARENTFSIFPGKSSQLLIQVMMIPGALSFVSKCGRGWMAHRGIGGGRVIPVISGF